MKKNLISSFAVFITLFIGINKTTAQVLDSKSKSDYHETAIENNDGLFLTGGIPSRALQDFSRSFKNIEGESWSKIKDGFTVTFFLNDQKNIVFYDKKGRWSGILKYLNPKKLPGNLRDMVKSTYYDYNILYAQEIETSESRSFPIYLIGIEDEKNIKVLRISFEGMELWNELEKAN